LGYRVNLDESAAQTYCNRIYVDDPYQSGDLNQIVLLAHELTHSRQCEEYGGAGGFGWHYFKEYYEGGGSYENNRLEREAFDFEAQFASEIDNQLTQNRAAYFDNRGTVFYANGTSYCGLASPKHLEFFQRVNQAPSLGRQDPDSFGTYAGTCTFPSGYFDHGGTVFFSSGNGNFCGFRNPQALESHQSSRPQQPSFGLLDRDPKRFMKYTGVCS
jgi:hypothetical protein